MIFDTAVAPRDRKQFLNWHDELEASEDYHRPDSNLAVIAPPMKDWFLEIIKTFPPMDGRFAVDDTDNPKVTDYTIGRSTIYANFAWSQAANAFKLTRELAFKHGVGLLDLNSREADIWWPMPLWKLQCESRGEIPFPLDLDFHDLLNGLDSEVNSFIILEGAGGEYIQCGGSNTACTVEIRRSERPGHHKRYVVGRKGGRDQTADVNMSRATVTVRISEVFCASEAAKMFGNFLAGVRFSTDYALRELDE